MRSGRLLLAALLAAGCSSSSPPEPSTPPGCGLVPASQVVEMVGPDPGSTGRGSVRALREDRTRLSCVSRDPSAERRSVSITAEHHPKPFRLPDEACSAGWVYAGTPEKHAPACQQAVGDGGTTQLIVRWQPYVMHVTIERPDRAWAGDPEAALELSRALARRLGVAPAD